MSHASFAKRQQRGQRKALVQRTIGKPAPLLNTVVPRLEPEMAALLSLVQKIGRGYQDGISPVQSARRATQEAVHSQNRAHPLLGPDAFLRALHANEKETTLHLRRLGSFQDPDAHFSYMARSIPKLVEALRARQKGMHVIWKLSHTDSKYILGSFFATFGLNPTQRNIQFGIADAQNEWAPMQGIQSVAAHQHIALSPAQSEFLEKQRRFWENTRFAISRIPHFSMKKRQALLDYFNQKTEETRNQ